MSTVDEVIKALDKNDRTNKIRKIHYRYDKLSRRSKIKLPKHCKLNIKDSDIARCLGFDNNTELINDIKKINNVAARSQSIASVNDMYKAIYVYADIIENQHVGNVRVPLNVRVPPRNQIKQLHR